MGRVVAASNDSNVTVRLREAATRSGYEFEAAYDVVELNRAAATSGIDILVFDMTTAVPSGIELVELGRKLCPDAAIAVITGREPFAFAGRLDDCRVVCSAAKPVDINDFWDVVLRSLD